VDWLASWCGPCWMFALVFEQATKANPDLVFAKVDNETQPGLDGDIYIMTIHTLTIVHEQVLVFSQPGALPAAALDDLISQVRALDMDEVHRAVADQRATASS